MNPFDLVADNPVYRSYREQRDLDDGRINLTDMWRTAGRPRNGSPRRWAQDYHYREEVTFEGQSADGPAWTDGETALIYAMHLDKQIIRAVCLAFSEALRADPVGMVMDCPDECRPLVAAAGAVMARDGDRTAAVGSMIAEAARRTEGLGVYAQETAVAKVRRAFLKAGAVRSGRVVDGEFIPDR
jgi:hypothetical protein